MHPARAYSCFLLLQLLPAPQLTQTHIILPSSSMGPWIAPSSAAAPQRPTPVTLAGDTVVFIGRSILRLPRGIFWLLRHCCVALANGKTFWGWYMDLVGEASSALAQSTCSSLEMSCDTLHFPLASSRRLSSSLLDILLQTGASNTRRMAPKGRQPARIVAP